MEAPRGYMTEPGARKQEGSITEDKAGRSWSYMPLCKVKAIIESFTLKSKESKDNPFVPKIVPMSLLLQ